MEVAHQALILVVAVIQVIHHIRLPTVVVGTRIIVVGTRTADILDMTAQMDILVIRPIQVAMTEEEVAIWAVIQVQMWEEDITTPVMAIQVQMLAEVAITT